jgi:non-ribosomal peptide synthetase component F
MLKMDCLKIALSHWKALQEKERLIAPGRCLIFGGERLTGEVVGLLRAGGTDCEVYNHYGPSETTIGKALGRIDLEKSEGKIPLGTPFGRTRIPAVRCADQLAAGGYRRSGNWST